MFCRGAARQFGLPWYWYIASYFMGYERDGKPNPNCYRTASRHGRNHGPNFGLSLSAIERTMWKAWLSGAGSYEREAMTDSIFDKDAKSWRLSDEGLVYERYYNVVTTHDRGVPYTPIALLVPMCRGASRALGRPFTSNLKCLYTHADHMTDAILATALDFPKNMTEKAMKVGVERVMANSRFGDLFDALTPDFPDQTSFRRILPAYPCAVLCGEYGGNRELSAILRERLARKVSTGSGPVRKYFSPNVFRDPVKIRDKLSLKIRDKRGQVRPLTSGRHEEYNTVSIFSTQKER